MKHVKISRNCFEILSVITKNLCNLEIDDRKLYKSKITKCVNLRYNEAVMFCALYSVSEE